MRRTCGSPRRLAGAHGGEPRRRRRRQPVEARADVEHRVGQRGGAREAGGAAQQHVGDGAVRDGEPRPVRPHEHAIERAPFARRRGPTRRERALQAHGRQLAEPERAVGDRSGSESACAAPARRRRRAATCTRPRTPTSAARTRRCRACASGARRRTGRRARRTRRPARRSAGAGTRLRASGAATPAATTPQAVARRSSRPPHAGEYMHACGARDSAPRRTARGRKRRYEAPVRALARVRAASTRPPTTGLVTSASGCHCTPSTNARSGSSMASISPSSGELALTSSPSPTRSTP